jgi:hypothetical protein
MAAFTSAESTSRNLQFWLLPPLGARTAASRMRVWASSGIGSEVTRRIARVV